MTDNSLPDLEQRIDALLRIKLTRLKLPRDIEKLFLERSRNNIRRTTAAWSAWVGLIVLVDGGFDALTLPHNIVLPTLATRIILGICYLATAWLIRSNVAQRLTALYIAFPCILTVAFAGWVGLASSNPMDAPRYLNEAMLAVASAIMFAGMDQKLSLGLTAITLPMIASAIAASHLAPAAKIQFMFFNTCVLMALINGARIQRLILARLFLLNMRDEFSNAKASARQEQLSSIAYTDKLTEIHNRRYFDEICARMSESTQNSFPLAICMIDIDHFKLLNDRLGHPQGDNCLKLVAATIRANLRNPQDIAARYGGEEFVLLLPGTDMNTAYEIAERIRAAVAELGCPNPAAPHAVVTVSIGVAELASPPIALQSLLQNADHALYRAKLTGRNRVST